MSNSLYNQLNNWNGMINSFPEFMRAMKGKNPNDIINGMVNSGQINQQQLNMVQQKANEMKNSFDGFKSMFGFIKK